MARVATCTGIKVRRHIGDWDGPSKKIDEKIVIVAITEGLAAFVRRAELHQAVVEHTENHLPRGPYRKISRTLDSITKINCYTLGNLL